MKIATLNTRCVLLLGCGVMVLSGLLLVVALWHLRGLALEQGEQHTQSVAHIVQEQMERTLQSTDQSLRLTADQLEHLHNGGSASQAVVGPMLRQSMVGLPYLESVRVLDPQGLVRYATADGAVGINQADHSYFQIYQTHPDTPLFLGEAIKSRVTGRWVVNVSRPTRGAQGELTGIIVAGLDPGYFDAMWADVDLGVSGAVGVFRRDSVLLLRSPLAEKSMGQAHPTLRFFGEIAAGQSAGAFDNTSPFDGVHRHYVYRELKHFPAVVVVGQATGNMLGAWTRMAAVALGVWLVAVVVLALLGFTLAQSIAARFQAARKLRKSDEQLFFALQGGNLGLWDWSAQSGALTVNVQWLTMLGLEPQTLKTTLDAWHARVHPDDMHLLTTLLEDVIMNPNGKEFEVEVRARHALGHWVWILDKGAVVERASDGSPLRVVGTHLDISMRKNAAEALRLSEHRWRFAIEGSGDGLWDWDIVSQTVFCSDRWKQMLGFTAADVGDASSEWESCLHPEDKGRVLADLQAHVAGATPHYINEHRVICKDGSAKWLLARGLVVSRSADGQALRMIGTITDMTERKAAELALERSNTQLRLLETCVSRLNDIVLITEAEPFDEPGPRIVFVNDAFERRTGYTREEVLGKTPRILHGPKTQVDELQRMDAAQRRWEPVRAELINYTKGGDEFWIEIDIVPVADASGWYTHWVAVERDITRRMQAQAALQASLDEKVVLLNEVHHRVKNNLQVVSSLLRLESRRSTHSETQTVLAEMQGRLRSMALLHESLYRSGIFASVGLDAYLKQLSQQIFRASNNTGAVRLVLDLVSVKVSMDQATPCGLLVNELISNCLKHGFPEGRTGEVRLALQPEGGMRWRLSVSDNGIGLPSDLDVRRNASLGLKLASDLATQLEAQLEVGPGPGASFAVSFVILES